MEVSFEQAVYLFVQQYREQQLNRISELFRNDGGPGSGNHGHQGVPGQVGGSAPGDIASVDGKYFPERGSWRRDPNQGWNKERRTYLSDRGFPPEKVERFEQLITRHVQGEDTDDEIREFVKENPDLVKAAASYEIEACKERRKIAIEQADKEIARLQAELEETKEGIKNGELSWYSSDPKELERLTEDLETKLEDAKERKRSLENGEIKLYRKGGYEDDVLSFTTDRDGVVLHAGTDHEQMLTPDHETTLSELVEQGIYPVGGFGAKFNFYGGESSEVTFVKIPEDESGRDPLPDFEKVKERLLNGSSDSRTAKSPLKQLTAEEFAEVKKLDMSATGQEDRTIEIGDLYSTQPTNSVRRLETVYDHFKDDPDALYDNIVRPDEFMQAKPNAPIRVVRYKGKNVIVDGNHRICILKALGEKNVKVKFIDLDKRTDNEDGGPGSGNWGHEGVPGQVGGSAPADGSKSEKSSKRSGKSITVHDAPNGAFFVDCDNELWKKQDGKFINQDTGEIADADDLEEFEPRPIESNGDLDTGYGHVSKEDLDRIYWRMCEKELDETGEISVDEDDVDRMVKAVSHYGLGGDCQGMLCSQDPDSYPEIPSMFTKEELENLAREAKYVDEFIERTPCVDRPVYRGMSFNSEVNPESLERALSDMEEGKEISFRHIASWTTTRGTAESYAASAVDNEYESGENYSIVYSLRRPKTVASLRGINPEGECLSSSKTRFRVKSVSYKWDDMWECHTYRVELEEI